MGAKNFPRVDIRAGWEQELEIKGYGYWKREALLAQITHYQQKVIDLKQQEMSGLDQKADLAI